MAATAVGRPSTALSARLERSGARRLTHPSPRPQLRPARAAAAPPVRAVLFGWGRQAVAAPPAEKVNLTMAEFEEMIVSSSTDAVFVNMCTPWCGPCQLQSKSMKALEPRTPKVTFYKLDAEKNDELAAHFEIKLLPTLLLFKGGSLQPVARHEGLLSTQDLELFLRKHTM